MRRPLRTLSLTSAPTLLAVAGLFCVTTSADAAKKVALLVGVNKYKKPGFSELKYAEADVTATAARLKGMGFDVTVLTGSDKQTPATLANIQANVTTMVKPLGTDDLFLVMLCGHGEQTVGGDARFCPVDAVTLRPETQLSLSWLINEQLAPNVGRKVVIVDACRNDPDPSRGRGRGIEGKRITLPEETVVFFGCKSHQRTYENDELKHGLFTHFLLEGLGGKAAREGEVSWSDLQAYVLRGMAREGGKYLPRGVRQTPLPAGGMSFTVIGNAQEDPSPKKFETKPDGNVGGGFF